MNARDESDRAAGEYAIGRPVRRTEDPMLLRGQGRYTDDLNEPGQAYAYMVRSQYAHGVIRNLDTARARPMPGVLAVYTAKDLAAYGPHKCMLDFKQRDGSAMRRPVRKSLAADKVRFVGDPVACVVAETALQAKDAAEAVEVDIDPLPAVTLPSEAAKAGAPQLYDDVPGNVTLDFLFGEPEKVAEAFAQAAHVQKLSLRNTRVVVAAMEPRSAICAFDKASGRWTLTAPGQGVHAMKIQLADILGVPPDKVHMLTPNVGGSFGMKGSIYPEYVCLAHAARELSRPVKWTDERSGSFLSDQHGRDHEMTAELALDKGGKFLAVRITGYGNVGAYLGTVAFDERGAQRLQRLPHRAPRGVDQGVLHQHDAGERVPRRRAPGGELLHGAPDRRGGARDARRPAGIAPPQPRAARGDSVQGRLGNDLRQR
jgi:carbon-monoxide dehydrogenase large subunit